MLEEIGQQCFPDQDAEYQAALSYAVQRFGTYAMANSNMTPADLKAFTDQMAERDKPRGAICQSEDALQMYRHARPNAAKIRPGVDEATAKPGPVEWGACL